MHFSSYISIQHNNRLVGQSESYFKRINFKLCQLFKQFKVMYVKEKINVVYNEWIFLISSITKVSPSLSYVTPHTKLVSCTK